jgi:hypothetical protein
MSESLCCLIIVGGPAGLTVDGGWSRAEWITLATI